MKVAIVSYGMGNLASVRKALEDLGASTVLAEHPASLDAADRAVLPGVGAFGEGMQRLGDGGWVDALRAFAAAGRPLLGICLGMQLLADAGEEGGINAGLGLVPGRVRRLDELGCMLRIPHVGWNEVQPARADALFEHIAPGTDFYFVHSYAFEPTDGADVLARAAHGVPFAAAVRRGSVCGTQFHPEKSSRAGRRLLRNFLGTRGC